ncbi:MAG: hypothetical protein M1827_007320 [Pycnora praestabilis]|nr:MAG: hypothetical protein M1827_007320 [Pycnora praestabilis]
MPCGITDLGIKVIADIFFTRPRYQGLLDALQSQSRKGPVHKADFIEKNQISMNALNRLIDEGCLLVGQSDRDLRWNGMINSRGLNEDIFCSTEYLIAVEAEILSRIKGAQQPERLEPDSLYGSPPTELVIQIAKDIIRQNMDGVSGIIKADLGVVHFLPTQYLIERREKLLRDLSTGTINWLKYADLEELGLETENVRSYLVNQLKERAVLLGQTAISVNYIEQLESVAAAELDEHGFTLVKSVDFGLSTDDEEALRSLVKENITDSRTGQNDDGEVKVLGEYLVLGTLLKGFATEIKETAMTEALEAWGRVGKIDFPWAAIIEAEELKRLNFDAQLLQLLLEGARAESDAAFHEEIVRLEGEAIAQFNTLWLDRVVARVQIYREGIEVMDDSKLRGELLGVLQENIARDIIPDTIRRAQDRRLDRGKGLNSGLETLRISLFVKAGAAPPEKSFTTSLNALKRFNSKQGIEWLNEDGLKAKKAVLVDDMVKAMSRDDDGPRLFLTLILVLLAASRPGIVYATGKFAPKLLKQLRGLVGSAQYLRLGEIKDIVREGRITAELKAEMRGIALNACFGDDLIDVDARGLPS